MAENLIGCVDGFENGEVFGWACDLADLNKRISVIAYVDGEPFKCSTARHYRPDVAEQLQSPGLCGFYIDLTRYPRRYRRVEVDVRYADGRSLQRSPLRATLPVRSRPTRVPTVILMHIAKTAGTTLREAIAPNYRPSEVGFVYPEPPGITFWDFQKLSLMDLAGMRFICGHFAFGLHDVIPSQCAYITVVRNPLTRLISHFYHLVRANSPLVYDGSRLLSLPEVLESMRAPELDNLMVRYFTGVEDKDCPTGAVTQDLCDLAAANAEKYFSFIALQEKADRDFPALLRAFGWKAAKPGVENVGDYHHEAVDPSWRHAIQAFDKWDLRLYQHLSDCFRNGESDSSPRRYVSSVWARLANVVSPARIFTSVCFLYWTAEVACL